MRKAFRVALADPFGPAHVEASRDVWIGETEARALGAGEPTAPLGRPDCNPTQLDRGARLLEQAERPVFLLGGGVIHEDATEAVVRLAEQTGIPVAALQYVTGRLPDASTRWRSARSGATVATMANRLVPQADLVIAIGARFDLLSTSFKYGVISPASKSSTTPPVPSQVGVVYPVAAALTGSTVSFVEGLLGRAERGGRRWEWADLPKARAEWEVERKLHVRETSSRSCRPSSPTPSARFSRPMA